MNKNQTDGAMNQIKGATKEGAGKLTGNVGLQVKGAAQKAVGKVQSVAGKQQDKIERNAKRV